MNLLAIDPASNKCGIAWFKDGVLQGSKTLIGSGDTAVKRRVSIFMQLEDLKIGGSMFEVTSEEPWIMGKNGMMMHRLLGMIEAFAFGNVTFIHPSTLKKELGHGSKDKLEVALAAGELLQYEEELELLADAIAEERFDETDAIAIGVVYLRKLKEGKLS